MNERTKRLISQDRSATKSYAIKSTMSDKDGEAFNLWDAFPKESAADSPCPFLDTSSPQAVTSRSPGLSEAFKYSSSASSSFAKKQRRSSDAANYSPPAHRNDTLDLASTSTNHLLHPVELGQLDEFTLSPLSPLKTEEVTSAEHSPLEKDKGNTSSTSSDSSPDIKSTGSSSSTDAWQARFEELKEYKAQFGNLEVPQKFGKLGIWVNKQRNGYANIEKGKKSHMTQERISQLNSIGFRWAKSKGPKLWEARFNELVEFKKKNGHCNVKTKGTRLGRWVTTQRSDYKKNKITEANKAKLDSIGFCWNYLEL